jgi:hypothetical protein
VSQPVERDGGKWVILAVFVAVLGWGLLFLVISQW